MRSEDRIPKYNIANIKFGFFSGVKKFTISPSITCLPIAIPLNTIKPTVMITIIIFEFVTSFLNFRPTTLNTDNETTDISVKIKPLKLFN